jgi:hypothetical protein
MGYHDASGKCPMAWQLQSQPLGVAFREAARTRSVQRKLRFNEKSSKQVTRSNS